MVDERLRIDLDLHIDMCERRFNERDAHFKEFMKSQAESTEALNHLTTATKDMIETYNHIKGAVVIGSQVQKLGLWIIKWPLVGYGLYSIYKRFPL